MEKYAKEIVTNSRLCIHQKRTLFSETVVIKPTHAHCLKVAQNVAFHFSIFHQFWPSKIDLSGNTVRPQASDL